MSPVANSFVNNSENCWPAFESTLLFRPFELPDWLLSVVSEIVLMTDIADVVLDVEFELELDEELDNALDVVPDVALDVLFDVVLETVIIIFSLLVISNQKKKEKSSLPILFHFFIFSSFHID